MKRLLPILLALLVVASLTLALASCDGITPDDNDDTSGNNEKLSFTSNHDGTCYVSNYDSDVTAVVIPFYSPSGDTVTGIDDRAFSGCTSLTSIAIPDSVTNIGDQAFWGCYNLKALTVPDSVTSIGASAFSGCTSLTSITIPSSVTSIGNAAFSGCSTLTSIAIPDSVTSIGESAFTYCTSLASIIIPDSVTSIGDDAFYHCTSLTSIEIPDSVTSIGDWAFSYCTSLASIIIPDSVTSIGESAFSGCSNLTSVTIGKSVTRIGERAFSNFYKPVEVINKSQLDITAGSEDYGQIARYAKEVHSGESKIVNRNDYLFYTYNGINYLLGYAGDDTELTLPKSYNGENYEIYKHAFYQRRNLTSVTIPNSVTSIGFNAFEGCYKLLEVINKSQLDITAGSSSNGYVAHYAIEVHKEKSKIVNKDGYLFYTYGGTNYLLGYAGDDTELTLPESYNGENYEVCKYAFYNCDSLTSVTIPNSATSIGDWAFSYCDSIRRITIFDSITSIGEGAFSNCENLTEVIFGDNSQLDGIGDYAFNDCDNLSYITIPDSVTSIGNSAFSSCDSLNFLTIGNGVTTIGKDAFSYVSFAVLTFKKTSGWKAGETIISASDLADSVTAADYLTSTYCGYTWTRD